VFPFTKNSALSFNFSSWSGNTDIGAAAAFLGWTVSMGSKSTPTAHEIAARVHREAFLRIKSLRQQMKPRRQEPLSVFLSGVGRSGTNMLMDILEASYETEVFHERDRRAFEKFIMRPPAVIHSIVDRSNAPVVVVKALHEADRIQALMGDFPPAKALWMVRFYGDSVNSHLKRWPGTRNLVDKVVNDRKGAGWRTAGMTDETYQLVCDHYRRGLTPASAHALFWYYRNQLFFDQALDRNNRVLVVEYEELVTEPRYLDRIASFVGLTPTEKMRRIAHRESIRKDPFPDIAPEVKALCDAMQARLSLVAKAGFSRDAAAAVVNG
jgi:hypothetical protein